MAYRHSFKSGSREVIHDIEGAHLELYGVRGVVNGDPGRLQAVSAKLVNLASATPSLVWLPGVQKRYSEEESAQEALRHVSGRRDAVSWLIQRTGDHSDRNQCDPEMVEGIATFHRGIELEQNGRKLKHPYMLAAFWTAHTTPFEDQMQIANALMYTLPFVVCRTPDRIVASLDGPISNGSAPRDPGAAFATVGELWEGVQVIDTARNTNEGITTASSTRIYRQDLDHLAR